MKTSEIIQTENILLAYDLKTALNIQNGQKQ